MYNYVSVYNMRERSRGEDCNKLMYTLLYIYAHNHKTSVSDLLVPVTVTLPYWNCVSFGIDISLIHKPHSLSYILQLQHGLGMRQNIS